MVLALLRAAQEADVPTDNTGLYAAVAAVITSLVGGVVAVITTRGRGTQTQEPNAILPREINDLWENEVAKKNARIADLEDDVEMWMQRAYGAGWRP